MASQDDSPKRRPVDALFGDSDTPSATGYIVEDPQPATTVSPPPPDQSAPTPPAPPPPLPAAPAASPIPTPEPVPARPAVPPVVPKPLLPPGLPRPVAPALAPAAHPAAAPLPAPPAAPPAAAKPLPAFVAPLSAAPGRVISPPSSTAEPMSEPEPIVPRPAAAPADRISQLYEQVRNQVGANRAVTNECLALLSKAREANSKQNLAAAEFYVESVQARLKRSALSQQAVRQPIVWIIGLWNLGMLGVSLLSLPITYILNLTFFGLAVAPEAILLLRAAAWGCIGAVLGTFAAMAWASRRREYDSASNWGYFARPIIGVILGGAFFVFSEAGIVAGNIIIGGRIIGPIFLYVFALLAGFGQDIIFESLWNLLRAFFRVQRK